MVERPCAKKEGPPAGDPFVHSTPLLTSRSRSHRRQARSRKPGHTHSHRSSPPVVHSILRLTLVPVPVSPEVSPSAP